MSSSAVARLVVGSLAAFGAVTLAVHLADEPASSVAVASAPAPYAAVPAYDVANGTTLQSARTALEGTLDRPEPDHSTAVPLPIDDFKGVVPGHEGLGPVHVDPFPEGASLEDPTDTASLLERAGLSAEPVVVADASVPAEVAGEAPSVSEDAGAENAEGGAETQIAAAPIPPGTPSTRGLSAHVAPSCSGTGTDGKRVQVLYVRNSGTASRFKDVLPVLRNEVANVDDVFALSARKTGGERRVRWVHDNCVPVITEVVLPAGSLNTNFNDTINALRAQGYTDRNRKYLAFADANNLCGVGTMYGDSRPTGNNNDGYAASYSRVDVNCWSHRSHSVPAHELVHNLGGVLEIAPNATPNGHCSDESDLMCYSDGSGIVMRTVCASDQEQLLDCRGDDYFNTAPAPGNFLATNWNTANSSFLDSPGAAPTGSLTVTTSASQAAAETGDKVTVTATSQGATSYSWTASQPCTLTGATTAKVDVVCPSTVSGPVIVTVTVSDASARTATASSTVQLTRAAAPVATVVAPPQIAAGSTGLLSAKVVGKAPFTYAWSTSGPCVLSSATASQPQVSCPSGSVGQTATFALAVTQADGQQAQAISAPVTVADSSTATTWSTARASSGTPSVISAVLKMAATGRPVAGVTVELQTRSTGSQEWATARTGLTTDSTGKVATQVGRVTAAWYRFAHVDTTGSGSSVSSGVFVKARAKARAGWKGDRGLVAGLVARLDGSPLAGETLTLQRRYRGTSKWVTVTRVTSTASGQVSARQKPRRTAYYRWVFRGSEHLLPTRSAAVRAR